MESIKHPVTHENIIKHSRFIAYLEPVFSKEEALKTLEGIKHKHPDAAHHCYAYIIGDEGLTQKAEDDGEPSTTAGIPMLESLKKARLTNVMAVVVRYFGGVKLGAGGLIRAYGKSVRDALDQAERSVRTVIVSIKVSVDFDWIGTIEHLIGGMDTPVDRSYDSQAHYVLILPEKQAENLRSSLKEHTRDQAQISIEARSIRYI